jgi:hypothetical protein
METRKYNARFCPKGDIEANWNKAVGFIPLDKEIIIYKADTNHSVARIKIGDGKTAIQDLPFAGADIVEIQKLIDEKCSKLIDENDDVLIEYVDNAITHLKEEIDEDATIFTVEVIGVYSYSFPDNVGITHIDWGDGAVGSELSHTYKDRGNYICRVYGANALTKNYHRMVLLEIGKSVTRIGERVTDGMFFSTRHLILPDTVTQIDDNAFSEVNSITSLIIGNGVTSIGEGAFGGLSGTSIVIPDSVQSIGDYTFKNCKNLTSVVIGDGITSINYEMFMNCKNLRSIVIPDNVTSIGERAFYNCQNLTSVVIGDKVTTIGKNAFYGCSGLTSVKFGDSVTSIGDSAFEGCSNLTHIEIPSCVTTIETDAFHGCEGLTTIEIPRNVSFLGANAFSGCGYLQSIIFKNPVPVTYTFEMIYGYSGRLTHIYVPYGCVEEYKTKWTADGALERILNLIVESDREAMMSDLNSKLDKTGGAITGNLSIGGNLTVAGTTTTKDTETIMVKDNTIVANSDGIELLEDAGFVIKTNKTDAYGIMYVPGEGDDKDGVKIGLGGFDENGKFAYNENQAQFLATRADTIDNGHIPQWDNEKKQFVDSGTKIGDYVKLTDIGGGLEVKNNKVQISTHNNYGLNISGGGLLMTQRASNSDIDEKSSNWKVIVPSNQEYATMSSLADCKDTTLWTDTNKVKACETIGAVNVTNIGAGLRIASDGAVNINGATKAQIDAGASNSAPLTTNNIRYAVKKGVTDSNETWTDDDKAKACETIGAIPKNFVDTNNKSNYSKVFTCAYTNEGVYKHRIVGIDFWNTAVPEFIPVRDRSNCNIYLPNPPDKDTDSANKKYVDDAIAAAGVSGTLYRHDIRIPLTEMGETNSAEGYVNAIVYNTRNESMIDCFITDDKLNNISVIILDGAIYVNGGEQPIIPLTFGEAQTLNYIDSNNNFMQGTYLEIDEDTVTEIKLGGSGGSDVDLSNYYTKEETDSGFVATDTEVVNPGAINRRLYGMQYNMDGTRANAMFILSAGYHAGGVAQYDGNRGLHMHVAPTLDTHCTNKKYVDDLVGDINTALEAILGV